MPKADIAATGFGSDAANESKFQFFSWLFADNVERLFVAAQPKESGMPHFALTSPPVNFTLAYELGDNPRAGDQRDYPACCASRSISCCTSCR